MQKRWVIKKKGSEAHINKLAKELSIDKALANLLVQRGIDDFSKAKNFFRPSLDNLYDPFLLKDIDKAIYRIDEAINKNQKIMIYGDYDADGITAVTIVYSYLMRLYKNVSYYIPDRYSEGYGVSKASIDYALKNNFSLIIALDCGIKAEEQIKYAKDNNIDFIVCDHHIPGDVIPDAYAILNPKQPDCQYPYKELSGCGVGFKLMQAYAITHNYLPEDLHDFLDLLAVSIASDLVPITDENRILTYYGLKKINSNPRTSLKALLKLSNLESIGLPEDIEKKPFRREITVNELSFLIGPRINAAGRVDSGFKAVELLISDDFQYTKKLAEYIDANNTVRKNLDSQITFEATKLVANDESKLKNKSTVIYKPGWHIGVVGIVASRLVETFYKPTVVLTDKEGLIIGSARSVKNFDIYNALENCSDLLQTWGGHKLAAGISLLPENLNTFIERFEGIVAANINDYYLIPEIEIDTIISLNSITHKFIKILKQFAPFGPENNTPVFYTEKVRDTGYAKQIGNNNQHLKLNLIQPPIFEDVFEAIAFNQADYYEAISKGQPFNICYTI
ncbi:MAG: single-stranded-DNA-specific exonuclease RecJ, partial [Bacteroidales bacterium]|nr:single-stranded-DNA-specific exonuclease RecJ [Bacteroidales bacterium]